MQGIKNWKVTVKPWGIQLPAIPLAIKPVTSKSNKKKEVEEYGDYEKKNEQYHKREGNRTVRFLC